MFRQNKLFKKITVVLTSLIITGTMIMPAMAAVKTTDSSTGLDEICKQYNLKDVDPNELPANIKPKEFKSVKDLNDYLAKKKADNDKNTLAVQEAKKNAILREGNLKSTDNVYTADYSPVGTQSKNVLFLGTGFIVMNVRYTYSYNYAISQNVFDSCQSISTGLSGIFPGIDYTQTDSWSSIIDGGRTLAAGARGIEKDYLVVSGVIKLQEVPREFYAEFYNP